MLSTYRLLLNAYCLLLTAYLRVPSFTGTAGVSPASSIGFTHY